MIHLTEVPGLSRVYQNAYRRGDTIPARDRYMGAGGKSGVRKRIADFFTTAKLSDWERANRKAVVQCSSTDLASWPASVGGSEGVGKPPRLDLRRRFAPSFLEVSRYLPSGTSPEPIGIRSEKRIRPQKTVRRGRIERGNPGLTGATGKREAVNEFLPPIRAQRPLEKREMGHLGMPGGRSYRRRGASIHPIRIMATFLRNGAGPSKLSLAVFANRIH